MNISLPADVAEYVHAQVASGRHKSPEEVVVAAVALLKQQEQHRSEQLEALRGELTKGLESLDSDGGIPSEEVFQELRRTMADPTDAR